MPEWQNKVEQSQEMGGKWYSISPSGALDLAREETFSLLPGFASLYHRFRGPHAAPQDRFCDRVGESQLE